MTARRGDSKLTEATPNKQAAEECLRWYMDFWLRTGPVWRDWDTLGALQQWRMAWIDECRKV